MADTQNSNNEHALRTLASQVANLSLSLALSDQAAVSAAAENEQLRAELERAQAETARVKLELRAALKAKGGESGEEPAV